MKLTTLGPNQTELKLGNLRILFSYDTPVAYHDIKTNQFFKTCKIWSNTTSRHINKWITDNDAQVVTKIDQTELNKLVA